jgi:spermidine/putrescine transport system permease protein
MSRDAGRLSLILLFMPFVLWIGLLIILPQLGIGYYSLREKVGFNQYEFGLKNYADFIGEPVYRNTLLRTAWMSILVTILALVAGSRSGCPTWCGPTAGSCCCARRG